MKEAKGKIREDNVTLDLNKIQKHEVEVEGLELHLTDWHNKLEAGLVLKGYSNINYPIKSWSNREEAKQEYQDLLDQFKRGDYKIHLYSNGKVKIELH